MVLSFHKTKSGIFLKNVGLFCKGYPPRFNPLLSNHGFNNQAVKLEA